MAVEVSCVPAHPLPLPHSHTLRAVPNEFELQTETR